MPKGLTKWCTGYITKCDMQLTTNNKIKNFRIKRPTKFLFFCKYKNIRITEDHQEKNEGLHFVRNRLSSQLSFAAGKIGTAELMALESQDRRFKLPFSSGGWRRSANRLANNAGFFPVESQELLRWNVEMRSSVANMDYLCAWQSDPFLKNIEKGLLNWLAPRHIPIGLEPLSKNILQEIVGYHWLVISPFVGTMRHQVGRLQSIHDPENKWGVDWDELQKQCRFLQCPLHWHLAPSPYRSWFHGLEELEKAALAQKFDVALIGAGAWSLPLAARIKKAGRSAIHTGGETQLLFGIKGKRWDNYGFYNSAWVSLPQHEAPPGREKIDNGCYW